MITPTTAARPDWTAIASAVTAPEASDPRPLESGTLAHRRGKPTARATRRHEHRDDLDRERPRRAAARLRGRLRRPHGPRHRGRRVHGLAPHRRAGGARGERPRVRARDVERRAEQHRAPPSRPQGALRGPHRPHLDRLPRTRAAGRPRPALRLPPRRAGPRRRVVAPPVRDRDGEHGRHAQPPPVDRRLGARAREVRHRGDVGGVRQRPRRRLRPPHVRRRRLADPPRALADQPEVDLRDGEGRGGLPHHELLRRVRAPRGRDADVQQLRPAPEPPLRHGHDRHPGAHEARDRARRARPPPGLLLLHGRGPRPPHGRRARPPGRRLRLRPGREHLDGRLGRPDRPHGDRARLLARRPPRRDRRGAQAARLERRDGAPGRAREADPGDRLAAARQLGGGRPPHDPLVRREPGALDRPGRLAPDRIAAARSG